MHKGVFFFFAPLEKPLVFLVAFALLKVQGQEIFESNEWLFDKIYSNFLTIFYFLFSGLVETLFLLYLLV